MVLKVTCLENELNNVKPNIGNKTSVTDSNKYSKSTNEEALAGTNDSENTTEKSESIHATEFKCDKCEYVFKKKSTLNKHIKTKHAEHECKSCKLKIKTAFEALKHTAQDHSSNRHKDKRESEST